MSSAVVTTSEDERKLDILKISNNLIIYPFPPFSLSWLNFILSRLVSETTLGLLTNERSSFFNLCVISDLKRIIAINDQYIDQIC